MGKEIAPRVDSVEAPKLKTRDLASFDRALRYAEAALVKGPKIQLGTGAEGSGVGIIVDNNPTAAARPGKGGAEAPAAAAAAAPAVPPAAEAAIVAQGKVRARDTEQPRRRSKVTTMYVRSGVPESKPPHTYSAISIRTNTLQGLQSRNKMDSRDVVAPVAQVGSPSKRDGGAIDAVNLNVSGSEGITMTFVETEDDDEE